MNYLKVTTPLKLNFFQNQREQEDQNKNTQVFLAKFDPSYGNTSLKSKSYNLKINSHNKILNSSISFTKDLFQISQ